MMSVVISRRVQEDGFCLHGEWDKVVWWKLHYSWLRDKGKKFLKILVYSIVWFFSTNFQLPNISLGKVTKDSCQLQGRKKFPSTCECSEEMIVSIRLVYIPFCQILKPTIPSGSLSTDRANKWNSLACELLIGSPGPAVHTNRLPLFLSAPSPWLHSGHNSPWLQSGPATRNRPRGSACTS